MLEKAPDTVLVHFVADAEVIAERMRADPSEHVSASGGQIMPQVVRAQPHPPPASFAHAPWYCQRLRKTCKMMCKRPSFLPVAL